MKHRSLKQELIKIGTKHPDLQSDLRPIIDRIVVKGKVSSISRRHSSIQNPVDSIKKSLFDIEDELKKSLNEVSEPQQKKKIREALQKIDEIILAFPSGNYKKKLKSLQSLLKTINFITPRIPTVLNVLHQFNLLLT
jgi:hypothetical protein